MTAILSFLKPEKPRTLDCVRFLRLLLQGMSLHAAEGRAEEVSRFRAEIDGVSERLTARSSSEEILVEIGAVIQMLKEQKARSDGFMNAHVRERQAMLAMMSSTIAFLATSSAVGVEQLQCIEKNLETTADIDDVRLFRVKLSECLTVVRNESVRVRDVSQNQIRQLKDDLDRAARQSPLPRSLDPTTGLGSRSEAEQMIASSILDGKDATLALFLVDRIAAINSRFGRKVGDEILLTVAQRLAKQLPEASPLFRWSGPAFIAAIDTRGASQAVDRQINQITSERLEKNINANGRTVMLPISCSAVVQRIKPGDSAEAVFHTLDRFVASHTGEPQ